MLRAVIIDDEVHAVGNLASLLEESGMVEIVGQFTNPFEALDKLDGLGADVVFLDIVMPGINGMTIANRLLNRSRPIGVVFVSAHAKYAVEAFEAGALDYLLKPVSEDRLQKTLWTIYEHLDLDEAE